MQINKKFLNLGLGAFLGQGSMLFTSFMLLAVGNSIAGSLTTALGVCALFLIVIDWGGQVVQRQNVAQKIDSKNLYEYVIARLPAFSISILLILILPLEVVGGQHVKSFLIPSIIGFFFSIFNMSGVLDISSKSNKHGLFSGLNYLAIAVYVVVSLFVTRTEIEMSTAGYINGLVLSIISLVTLRWACIDVGAGEPIKYKSTLHVFQQGFWVVLSAIPGQIISRAISVSLLQGVGDGAAAKFNFIKSFSGVFNQCVTLLRRAEFKKIFDSIDNENRGWNIFRCQLKSLVFGAIAIIIGVTSLLPFVKLLNITYSLVFLLAIHSALWLVSSAYFNFFQIIAKNWLQPIHTLTTCLIAVGWILVMGVSSPEKALLLEFSVSFSVFIFIYFARRAKNI